ncbi:MAG: ABC transporter permease [Bacillota bacterium]|nr:ABC transporter permease [Bacillota bacterium]
MAMLSMFILFTGGQGGRMMLEEKNQYTYQRMSVSGISKWQIFFGKFITVLIIGIVQISIMIAYTTIVLKVSWGNFVNVALITTCALLAVAAMGVMISAITLKTGNFKVANLMENFIFQIMAFLGGSFVPVEMLPKMFSKISYFTINGLTLKAYLLNMQGYSILEYRSLLGILLGITVLFISIGIAIMNREKRWKNVEHHTPADT